MRRLSDFPPAERLLLHALVFVLDFMTRKQAARLCGVALDVVDSMRESLGEAGYLSDTFIKKTPAPGLCRGPVYARGGDWCGIFQYDPNKHTDAHFRWLSNQLRLSAEERKARGEHPTVVLAATPRALEELGEFRPDAPREFEHGHSLNVAELVVQAHELAMDRRRRGESGSSDPNVPRPVGFVPWTGLSPFFEPGRHGRHVGSSSLMGDFLDEADRLFGRAYIAAKGLGLGEYAPDLGYVRGGQVQHAAVYGAGLSKDKLDQIASLCESYECTLEIWK
jgi:hypothetical protein